MVAAEALDQIRQGADTPANRARFEQHGKDLGYGMLLTPYASNIAKAGEAEIAKAVDDSIPPVAPLFWGFRVMVGLGVTMLGLMVVSFVQLCRNRLQDSPRLLKTLLWSIPLPWIAIEAGWLVAELGRQPWTISDVLPVSASVSFASAGPTLVQPHRHLFHLHPVAGGGVVPVAPCDPQGARHSPYRPLQR